MNKNLEAITDSTAVVIPAFNADRFVADVIERTSEIIPKERIVVIDDGSVDATASVARAAGALLLVHEENQGKGVALHTGILKAAEMGMERKRNQLCRITGWQSKHTGRETTWEP